MCYAVILCRLFAAALSLSIARAHLAADDAMHHCGLPNGGSPALGILVPDSQHVGVPTVQLFHTLSVTL